MKTADLKGRGLVGGPSRRGRPKGLVLEKQYIERLQRFKSAEHDGARHGYNVVQLKIAMSAPFTVTTLRNALRGRRIGERSYSYIVQWIDRYLPVVPGAAPALTRELPFDHKMAAANDHTDEGD